MKRTKRDHPFRGISTGYQGIQNTIPNLPVRDPDEILTLMRSLPTTRDLLKMLYEFEAS